eukprot:CAMPEP_0185799730 /NCGR_PEP_ID=MMETSP1322-20130828/487_1 /TAXON_ID=265543 /ORGANISM="Minutocellus polymorphus, Strain RCC2270" /LENGTH=357 /DNA_ID=CAMNT_0028495321 /DNA_START=294 /DNA_END=1367 /DNA_ORIENTATION=+
MGGCLSSPEDRAATRASRNIERMMGEQNRVETEKVKLLLLGAGESGKSTIFKQMRILFGAPLTEEEKSQITPVVYINTITSMKILVTETTNLGYQEEVEEDNRQHFDLVANTPDNAVIDATVGSAIKALWKDAGVKKAWERRAEYQIVESVKYYFNEIDRIMAEDYVATQQDMLLARVRTSGIVTERYVIDGKGFEMYDVGGQRNERKKWIHCFDDVTAVIFVAALSEYDQVLMEDSSMNRMAEAVDLFEEICNNRYFTNSSMILFLNKKDLFEEKIKAVHIGDQEGFGDFPAKFGQKDYYDAGVEYFLKKFLDVNRNPDRVVYNHVTCATDSRNVKVVFNATKDIIMRKNFEDAGI